MVKFEGTGGQILVEMLVAHGVERLSCVAGESYLPVLDALLDRPAIQVITCRQEGGAGFMAESWGKLTGAPGICLVTRGPGACNAAIAAHAAKQDSTPLIVFMGQVRREERGREAFQEIDVRAVFGTLAKWATEIDDPARIPEIVSRAFHVATTGRPGPVVIGLPEDMLRQTAATEITPPFPRAPAAPRAQDIESVFAHLRAAHRPVMLVGGSGWTEDGLGELAAFARVAHLPVTVAFRRHDLFDHRNGCYAGELGTGPNPKLLQRVKDSDLLLVLGARLDEITTQGYTLIENQTLIHLHPDESELGKVYAPAFGLACDPNLAVRDLAAAAFKLDARGWAAWRDDARKDYNEWIKIDPAARPALKGADMTLVFDCLRGLLPADSIITTDAGNFSGWAQRYLHYGRPGRLLAPVCGAMGYSVPSAIAASLAHPDRLVVGICGDGGFMMNGQELATAMHHGAVPVIILCNNGMYGTIRMHQERQYPGRISATTLTNPDFVKLAQSYGAFAARITRAEDFESAFAQARTARRAAILEIKMDPCQITTRV